MGLKNTSEKLTYVKIKDGKFYRSTDKELTEPFGELEGKITGLDFRTDVWEGQDIRKFVITMNDGEEDYKISFGFDSSYTTSLVGFLKNADLSKVLSIVPVEKDNPNDKTKKTRSLLVSQGGRFLKSAYHKDSDVRPPQMVQTTVNRKKVWDKTDYLDFYEKVILEELKPEVSQETPEPKAKKVTVSSVMQDTQTDGDDIESDLPF